MWRSGDFTLCVDSVERTAGRETVYSIEYRVSSEEKIKKFISCK